MGLMKQNSFSGSVVHSPPSLSLQRSLSQSWTWAAGLLPHGGEAAEFHGPLLIKHNRCLVKGFLGPKREMRKCRGRFHQENAADIKQTGRARPRRSGGRRSRKGGPRGRGRTGRRRVLQGRGSLWKGWSGRGPDGRVWLGAAGQDWLGREVAQRKGPWERCPVTRAEDSVWYQTCTSGSEQVRGGRRCLRKSCMRTLSSRPTPVRRLVCPVPVALPLPSTPDIPASGPARRW